jgi:hypothetical protein
MNTVRDQTRRLLRGESKPSNRLKWLRARPWAFLSSSKVKRRKQRIRGYTIGALISLVTFSRSYSACTSGQPPSLYEDRLKIASSVTYPSYPTFFKAPNIGRKSMWPFPGILLLQSEMCTAASRSLASTIGLEKESSSTLVRNVSYTTPTLLRFTKCANERASLILWMIVL